MARRPRSRGGPAGRPARPPARRRRLPRGRSSRRSTCSACSRRCSRRSRAGCGWRTRSAGPPAGARTSRRLAATVVREGRPAGPAPADSPAGRRRWPRPCLVAGGLALALTPGQPPVPVELPESAAAPVELATAIKVEGVRWEDDSPTPGEGSVVTCGPPSPPERPADAGLLQRRVADRRRPGRPGVARRRPGVLPPRQAAGPGAARGRGVHRPDRGYEVVDLGTEFALNLEPGGKSRVMVFEGEAAVSVLGKDGRSGRRCAARSVRKSVEIDPGAGRIRDVPAAAGGVRPAGQLRAAAAGTRPRLRRRGPGRASRGGTGGSSRLPDGRVPNEVAGRPPLAARRRRRAGAVPRRQPLRPVPPRRPRPGVPDGRRVGPAAGTTVTRSRSGCRPTCRARRPSAGPPSSA